MKLIKITTSDMRSLYGTKWEIGVKQSINPNYRKPKLCTEGVFHAYTSLEQALLMKEVHGWIANSFRIFEAEGDPVVDDGTKCGCYELTLTHELTVPEWYRNDEVFISIGKYLKTKTTEYEAEYIQKSIDNFYSEEVSSTEIRHYVVSLLDLLSTFGKINFPALVADAIAQIKEDKCDT